MRALLASTLIAFAVPAWAEQHRMRISEVQLSASGSTANQFVELHDTGDETFPSADEELVVYDADGVELGAVALSSFLDGDDTQDLYVVSTAASGIANDAELTVALPAVGQVCFEGGGTIVHCLSWGCINTAVGLNRGVGAPPPDGQSLQRQSSGAFHLAAPTPGEVNIAGSNLPACQTSMADAGAVIDAGPLPPDGEPGPDAAPPTPDAPTDSGGDDDGCGCRVGGEPAGARLGGWLLLCALLWVVSRSPRPRPRRRRPRG